MGKIKWEPGTRFGKLVLVKKTKVLAGFSYNVWQCKCDCGHYVERLSNHLRRTKLPACDFCRSTNRIKWETGTRFGKLVLVEKTKQIVGGRYHVWRCQCDCGRYVERLSNHLRRTKLPACDICRPTKQRFSSVLKPGLHVFDLLLIDVFRSKYLGNVWLCKCKCGKSLYVEENLLRPVVRELNGIRSSLKRMCHGMDQNKDIVECLGLIRNMKKMIVGGTNGQHQRSEERVM